MPKWDGRLWQGKAKYSGVIFTKPDGTNEILPASDPRFNDFIALSYEDFRTFMGAYVYGCKQFKLSAQSMSPEQALERFKILIEAWQTEAKAAK